MELSRSYALSLCGERESRPVRRVRGGLPSEDITLIQPQCQAEMASRATAIYSIPSMRQVSFGSVIGLWRCQPEEKVESEGDSDPLDTFRPDGRPPRGPTGGER